MSGYEMADQVFSRQSEFMSGTMARPAAHLMSCCCLQLRSASISYGVSGGTPEQDETMEKIEFSPEEKSEIAGKVKMYFREELDQEIGAFDAEFLIDFFADEIGAYFYNRGLYDAQALLAQKVEELGDSLYELERPTDLRK